MQNVSSSHYKILTMVNQQPDLDMNENKGKEN